MVVKSLSLKHLGQVPLVPGWLLQLGPLVLKPDFQLVFWESQLWTEMLPPLLCEVPVGCELVPQSLQLICGEGCSRSLIIHCRSFPLHFLDLPCSWSTWWSVWISSAEDPSWPKLAIWTSDHSGGTVGICFRCLVWSFWKINRNLHVHLWWLLLDRGGFDGGFCVEIWFENIFNRKTEIFCLIWGRCGAEYIWCL